MYITSNNEELGDFCFERMWIILQKVNKCVFRCTLIEQWEFRDCNLRHKYLLSSIMKLKFNKILYFIFGKTAWTNFEINREHIYLFSNFFMNHKNVLKIYPYIILGFQHALSYVFI